MIDESKSFKDQVNLLKKKIFLYEYYSMEYYDDDDDNKKLNLKIFKLKIAYLSNYNYKKVFKELFGCTFLTLANKLINTTNKEENHMIISDIKKYVDKLYERDDHNNFVIQIYDKRSNLFDPIKIISEFNKTIQLDLTPELPKKQVSDFNQKKTHKTINHFM